jgi:glycosyltransferase involved in cell wall biosynthesis
MACGPRATSRTIGDHATRVDRVGEIKWSVDVTRVDTGGGPEEQALRDKVGDCATFLGWLDGDEFTRAYASADLFLFASRTDTFGQVLLEAQASGLPVVAVAEGGPLELVADGSTGRLCPPHADALAGALVELATRPGPEGGSVLAGARFGSGAELGGIAGPAHAGRLARARSGRVGGAHCRLAVAPKDLRH